MAFLYDVYDEDVTLQKKLLTLKEVSRIYSISLSTLYRLSAKGKLPNYRIGKRVLVSPVEFQEWLNLYRSDSIDF